LFSQSRRNGIVVETLFGDGALFDILGASLVECLSMREYSNLLVTQFVLADFAHHVFSDHQVSLLQVVVLSFTVDLLDSSQLDLDLLVFLSGHLVVKYRL
jgi:hypothetical protein